MLFRSCVRFSVWMLVGFLVYGCYGWRNSTEEYLMKGLTPPGPREDDKGAKEDFKLGKIAQDKNENYFDDFE